MTDIEKISKYLFDPDNKKNALPKKLADVLERLYFADDQIREHGAAHLVCPILMEKFDISRTTAFNDYRDAQMVFGSQFKADKDYHLGIALHWIKETRDKAAEKGNLVIMAQCEKNYLLAIEKMTPKADFDFEQIKPINVEFGFFPSLNGGKYDPQIDERIEEVIFKATGKRLSINDIEAMQGVKSPLKLDAQTDRLDE
jgi:hypothetical protein